MMSDLIGTVHTSEQRACHDVSLEAGGDHLPRLDSTPTCDALAHTVAIRGGRSPSRATAGEICVLRVAGAIDHCGNNLLRSVVAKDAAELLPESRLNMTPRSTSLELGARPLHPSFLMHEHLAAPKVERAWHACMRALPPRWHEDPGVVAHKTAQEEKPEEDNAPKPDDCACRGGGRCCCDQRTARSEERKDLLRGDASEGSHVRQRVGAALEPRVRVTLRGDAEEVRTSEARRPLGKARERANLAARDGAPRHGGGRPEGHAHGIGARFATEECVAPRWGEASGHRLTQGF
mmetsp:Transcript_14115/g.42750  ORF Transcript_14115/g.42750 Transcript_14115/m.42750 type:complete len:292 (-) Transcript_14115:670-1545(-)